MITERPRATGLAWIPAVLALMAIWTPASAASPPAATPACPCLETLLPLRLADMTERRRAYDEFAAQIEEEAKAVEADRLRLDVTDEAAVDRFRVRADDLAAERRMLHDTLLPRLQAAIADYASIVERFNAECAGRPVPDAKPAGATADCSASPPR